MSDLVPGQIAWAMLDPVRGREQGGRRRVVVVSGSHYLEVVDTLVQVIPATSVQPGWANHVNVGCRIGPPVMGDDGADPHDQS